MKLTILGSIATASVILSIFPLIGCAPVEGEQTWKKGSDLKGIKNPDIFKQQAFLELQGLTREEQNGLLREILKLLGRGKHGSELPDDNFELELDDKDELYSPYFFKKHISAHNPEGRLNAANPKSLEEQISKRKEDETYTPYFLKRANFYPRNNRKVPEELKIPKYPFVVPSNQEFQSDKRGLSSLDIENYLASKGAYERQIQANQAMFDGAGK